MDEKKKDHIKVVSIFAFYAFCFFFAYKRLAVLDHDAGGAYVCGAAAVAALFSLKISHFRIMKKTIVALAILTVLLLTAIYFDSCYRMMYEDVETGQMTRGFKFQFSIGSESGNVFTMIPMMAISFLIFYMTSVKKRSKQIEEDEK